MESVINVSEGRDPQIVAALAQAAGKNLLDIHSDPDHHRSVITLAGVISELMTATQAVARAAVALIDLRPHQGAHPRFGALDVVPFVSLSGWPVSDGSLEASAAVRDDFARWAGQVLDLPCFTYGPEPDRFRSLPDVRREAWRSLTPDFGPAVPHPTAGACAVGARPILVAYNLWLDDAAELSLARRVAAAVRGPHVRALGLQVGHAVQVSCNLIAPRLVGPGAVFDAVANLAAVARSELVGLAPLDVVEAEPPARWNELGLDPLKTIETRLEWAGLDGGSLR